MFSYSCKLSLEDEYNPFRFQMTQKPLTNNDIFPANVDVFESGITTIS
jgi:hypothetical protein